MLAAAETGSGKTGAFGLPILQVVHESIRSRQAGGTTVSGYAIFAQTHHLSYNNECFWLPKAVTCVQAAYTPLIRRLQYRHHEKEKLECVLSADDRDALFAVSPDGKLSQPCRCWRLCMALPFTCISKPCMLGVLARAPVI